MKSNVKNLVDKFLKEDSTDVDKEIEGSAEGTGESAPETKVTADNEIARLASEMDVRVASLLDGIDNSVTELAKYLEMNKKDKEIAKIQDLAKQIRDQLG